MTIGKAFVASFLESDLFALGKSFLISFKFATGMARSAALVKSLGSVAYKVLSAFAHTKEEGYAHQCRKEQ